MDAISNLLARTSYRGKYKQDAVPREDLRTILEAGLAAPSGCNKQTTSLIAIDSPEVLSKLVALLGTGVGITAPAMVCVLTRRIVAYADRTYYKQDYSAAIQNMLLAICALGYESCWVEGHITDKDQIGRQMADVLGVPQEYELVCYLPVGIPVDDLKHVRKQPFEQRACFNGFELDEV